MNVTTQGGRGLSGSAAGFAGEVVRPDDTTYDSDRRVFNGLIDKRPAMILRCRSAADVVEAIAVARDSGLAIAVRGGGHNIAGRSATDGGVVIDLSPMKEIVIDADARTALVGPGVTWAAFNDAAFLHGLGTTGGTISTTGIAGLTLGGGFGWLMARHGLAADNLVAAEVVTADGRVLQADHSKNPDLFWAIRGGGGNFGIVTRFHYRLHPIGMVLAGLIAHPFEAATDLLRFCRDFAEDASDAMAIMPLLVSSPDESGTRLGAVGVFHAGPIDVARAELDPLVRFGSPLLSTVDEMSYPAVNAMLDDGFPAGNLYYWKSSFVRSLSDAVIDILVSRFASCPSPSTGVAIEQFHGAVTRVPVAATAVPHRDPGYNVLIASGWREPTATEANIEWTRETYAALEPHFVGRRYVNYLSSDDTAVRDVYGPNYDRLTAIKRQYDPDNLFQLNQNIQPAGK